MYKRHWKVKFELEQSVCEKLLYLASSLIVDLKGVEIASAVLLSFLEGNNLSFYTEGKLHRFDVNDTMACRRYFSTQLIPHHQATLNY